MRAHAVVVGAPRFEHGIKAWYDWGHRGDMWDRGGAVSLSFGKVMAIIGIIVSVVDINGYAVLIERAVRDCLSCLPCSARAATVLFKMTAALME